MTTNNNDNNDNVAKRFTDEEIHAFHLDYLKHKEHEIHDRTQLMKCMNDNKNAVQELTKSTKGLVEAWEATQGAVKVSVVIGRFVAFLSSFGFIAWGILEFAKIMEKTK